MTEQLERSPPFHANPFSVSGDRLSQTGKYEWQPSDAHLNLSDHGAYDDRGFRARLPTQLQSQRRSSDICEG
jgi:hypothetical protein